VAAEPPDVPLAPDDELRPPEKSGKPEVEALAVPELPLAPPLLACEPALCEPGLCEPDDRELDELLEGIDGIDDDDDDDDEGMDGDGMDDELLLDDEDEDDDDEDEDGICGMLLDDCCDCCVDSQALSNSAVTLRLNKILVRGIFMITDSNRPSQCVEFTVIKTGSRHHYCVPDSLLSIS